MIKIVLSMTVYSLLATAQASVLLAGDTTKARQQELQMRVPAAPRAGEKWQPGIHYNVLMDGTPAGGHVELIEMYMYTSFFGTGDVAAQKEFRLKLTEWLQKNSERITYVRRPSIAGMPHARLLARAFFTLEELKRSDLHDAMEVWVKDPKHKHIYHNIWEPDEQEVHRLNLAFADAHGLDQDRWTQIYRSKEVTKKTQEAEAYTGHFAVQGTPTFVINRRYSTSAQRLAYPRSPERSDLVRLLDLIKYLAISEMQHQQNKR